MSALEVGNKLVGLFNEGKFDEIYENLYSPEIVSVEADGMEAKGFEGLQGKNQWWEENFETHSMKAEGPFPHGEGMFGVIYEMDTTHKPSGQRSQSRELGIYQVKDGKVCEERFCYTQ